MNLKIIVVVLIHLTFLCRANGYAQKDILEDVFVLNQTKKMQLIGTSISYFEDTTASLSFEQISSPNYQDKFQKSNDNIFVMPPSASLIWIKFSIQNQTDEDIWIDFGGTFSLHQLYFYQPKKSVLKLGALHNDTKEQFPSTNYVVKIADREEKQLKTFYAQIKPVIPLTIPLQVGTTIALTKEAKEQDYTFVAFVSLLLTMCVYNLFLFYSTKDKIYLIYILYLIVSLFAVTFDSGHSLFDSPFFWKNYYAWHNLLYVASVAFASYYLELQKRTPTFFKIFWLSVFFSSFVIPVLQSFNLLNAVDLDLMDALFILINSAFSIGVAIYLWIKGLQKAFFYLLSWSFFVIGGFVLIFTVYGLLPFNIFTKNSMYLGAGIEILLFGVALANRLNTLKKEKELAQLENIELVESQKQELEQKVEQRTSQLQIKNEELSASEEELKQNFEELKTTQEKLNTVNGELHANFAILENKNEVIAQKNNDITSSINYAKRIQDAMLTKSKSSSKILSNSFIYFKPRDIVSGDFYYFNQVKNKTIVAAIDCTGHGVPGAFMSLIGNNLLNQIIENEKITEPSQILIALDKNVSDVLNQSHSDMRDGMDVALCVIDLKQNKIEYAGAKNPLIYIQDQIIETVKADRVSVGGNFDNKKEVSFTTHTLLIDKPTTFYIYSDGFQDQFGGQKDKKYTTKRFRQTLLQASEKSFSLQEEFLETEFQNWKGKNTTQVDDVLVIGFEINP